MQVILENKDESSNRTFMELKWRNVWNAGRQDKF